MTDRQRQQRFEALLHEHRGIIFKVASVYARDAEDRQDLAQEISVQLWRAFGSYDERRAKLSTWIYRIALNVAISQLRREKSSIGRTGGAAANASSGDHRRWRRGLPSR